jgi:phosphosulfolactate phosphohydrolase-like enzyme
MRNREDWDFVCAGTHGSVSLEDSLFAGSVISTLAEADIELKLDDSAHLCRLAWEAVLTNADPPVALGMILTQSRGGQGVLRLGLEADLRFALEVDRYPALPEVANDASGLWIRLPGAS